MTDYFINRYYILTAIALIIFIHVMQSLNKVEFTKDSFINDQSIKDLLAKNNCFVPQSLKEIDWHNYDQIKREGRRRGLGEQGKPAKVQPMFESFGLNKLISNKISLSRALPDVRRSLCTDKKYIESLPTVSVIIPFHDEHLNTFLRTIHSVISRSPPELIKEILLVDDVSNLGMLQKHIKNYITKYAHKVKVLKLAEHNGIIRAKLHGAKEATGDVLVFLDAHCEVNVNWLPPLLDPIARDYRSVIEPIIDKIDDFTFEYKAVSEHRGGFDWSLNFKQMPLPIEISKKLPEPYENPVMSSGIFAISRIFFWELGGYDPGLYIWGGDQYELSFKIWLCGGRLLTAPCSHVGHIIHRMPVFLQYGYGDFVRKNNRRVVDVWMDEFASKVYLSDKTYAHINPGDISEQLALRQRLKCKPFSWFMSNVAADTTNDSEIPMPSSILRGQVRPLMEQRICVNADINSPHLSLSKCNLSVSDKQVFLFTDDETIQLKGQNMCWDLPDAAPKSQVHLRKCHGFGSGGNQIWRYDSKTLQIIQRDNCLDWMEFTYALFVKPCDDKSDYQKWIVAYSLY